MHAYHGLSNSALLDQFGDLVIADRELTADLIECLAEIDERELHLGKGFTSMHGFCVEKYGFSEDMAFKRIRVARAVRRWPILLEHLREGRLSPAAIVTLAPHLDE